KSEDILECGLKAKEYKLRCCRNFGFTIQEHIDLGARYHPAAASLTQRGSVASCRGGSRRCALCEENTPRICALLGYVSARESAPHPRSCTRLSRRAQRACMCGSCGVPAESLRAWGASSCDPAHAQAMLALSRVRDVSPTQATLLGGAARAEEVPCASGLANPRADIRIFSSMSSGLWYPVITGDTSSQYHCMRASKFSSIP
ncbi:hypothetical protein C8J57DRAFT_1080707, partial [Mycena rebaudengoi]